MSECEKETPEEEIAKSYQKALEALQARFNTLKEISDRKDPEISRLKTALGNACGEAEALGEKLAEAKREILIAEQAIEYNQTVIMRAETEREKAADIGLKLHKEVQDLKALLDRAEKVIETLMPGARHLALQDYQELNEVPLAIKKVLGS